MARSSPIWTFYSVVNNDDDKAKCKLCLIIIFYMVRQKEIRNFQKEAAEGYHTKAMLHLSY